MAYIELLVGLGLVGFLLVYIMFKLGEKQSGEDGYNHFILKFLMMCVVLSIILLIAKTSYDAKDNCSWNVANSTISGSTTSYGYTYQCETNTQDTNSIFYRVILYFVLVAFIYFFFYIIYQSLEPFKKLLESKFRK